MRNAVPLLALILSACGGRPAPSRAVVAYPVGPASLVPDLATEEFTASILGNVYEPLVQLDRALVVGAGLAESWHSEDDLTWVFRLRAGVRLHDGRPLDAATVVACLEHARAHPDSRRRAELTPIERIEARDSRTVVLRTRAPFAALPNRLASVPIWAQGTPPLGTGRYRIEAWVPRGDTVLTAFDAHRDGPPPLRRLEFRAIPDAMQRARAVRGGDVHLAVDVPTEAVLDLASAPGVRIAAEKGLRVVFLGMDCAGKSSPHVDSATNPFRDPRVRRAVAHAIDRRALVAGPLGGHGEVADQLVTPASFGFDDGLEPIAFDPGVSRRLLTEAGFPQGFGVALDFMPGKYRGTEAVVQALVTQLAAVGIRVRARRFEREAFVPRVEAGDTAFYLLGWMNTSGDAEVAYDYLVHTPGEGYGQKNGGRYSAPEVDRLLEQASQGQGPEARLSLLVAVARKLRTDLPVVPLYRLTDLYAVARGLVFEPRVDRLIAGWELRWEEAH